MSKAKLLGLAAFAAFAIMAPATAIANTGGEWLVNGTRLANGATLRLLPTALVLAFGHLKITGVGSIECTGEQIEIEEGQIIGPDGILANKIGFKECAVTESEVCKLEGEKIQSVPIDGLASLDLQGFPASLNAYILLLPKTKAIFATIKFIGASCALLGTQPIQGSISLLVHGALHELLLHLVLTFSLPKALKVGSTEAELLGLDFDIALLQHEKWGFH